MKKIRTAILFTANTLQVAQANLMISSLRNKEQGNFKGDIWVLSTNLSGRAQNYLDSENIKFHINSLETLYYWKDWVQIAKAQPEYKKYKENNNEAKSLKLAFETFRNKRMSKLIIIDWFWKFGKNYDYIALCDNDILFQKDINKLLENSFKKCSEKIMYWQEENEISANSWIWKKEHYYSLFYDNCDLDFGKHEINIGFIMATPQIMYNVFNRVRQYFFDLNIKLFTDYYWHDQDLVRLDKAKFPEYYELLEEGKIVHLCNGGVQSIYESMPGVFAHKKTNKLPYVIHFAGGAWKNYESIKNTFIVDPGTYFFHFENKKSFDNIRNNSQKNIFDELSVYYTENNKKTKLEARRKWIDLSNNGKKRVLVIGWLQVSTHKSIYNSIPQFFESEIYNLGIINGNVMNQEYKNVICEEMPQIIASLTQIVENSTLIRFFGMKMKNIPEWVIEDGIVAAIKEYRCSKRTARAVANLVYLYFSEAIGFYRPDVVLDICTTGLTGKIIQNICKEKNIPIADLEWGVLPGTITFDFTGHMAESWIVKYADNFNNLKLEEKNLKAADDYLLIANNPEFSRNKPQKIDFEIEEKIKGIKKAGKKIILYMESNNAGSGNTFVDLNRAKKHSPIYKDDEDAFLEIVNLCKFHDDWHILYKPHPISITRGINPVVFNDSTTVIYNAGLNEALELADMAVTLLSQSAYISMLKNIPTVVLGRLQINESGAVYSLKNKLELEDIICESLKEKITQNQKIAFKNHVARCLTYYLFSANPQILIRNDSDMAECFNNILEGNQASFYNKERKAYLQQIPKKKNNIKNPLVSIIMPVHNVENYLSESINSVLAQTEGSFELICIENGSSDYSEAILHYFEKIDKRIKVFKTDILGLGNARNEGLKKAKGKYILFLDSDDTLDKNALKDLTLQCEEKDIDVLYFFYRHVENGLISDISRPRFYAYRKYFPIEKLFKVDDKYEKFFIQYPFAWAKIIKKEYLEANNILFREECFFAEDNPHNLEILLNKGNIYAYNEQLYNYRIRKNSITQKKSEKWLTALNSIKCMNELLSDNDVYEKYQKWYVPYKLYLAGFAYSMVSVDCREEFKNEVIKLFRESDKAYIDGDESWSYFELPRTSYAQEIIELLSVESNILPINSIVPRKSMRAKHRDAILRNINNCVEESTEKENVLKEDNLKSTSNEEISKWDEISKIHQIAIKICEKLHIIKFAIKVKKIFVRKKKIKLKTKEFVNSNFEMPVKQKIEELSSDKEICADNIPKIIIAGAMTSFDKGTCNYINCLASQMDHKLILISENQFLDDLKTSQKIRIPFSIVPNFLAKDYYVHIDKLYLQKKIKKYVNSKEYLLWGKNNLLLRHKDMNEIYAYYLVFYMEKYIEEILKIINPQKVILWNEFYAFHHILKHYCSQNNIEVIYMEFGSIPGTISIEKNGQMGKSYPGVCFNEFSQLPVSNIEKEKAKEIIKYLRTTKINRNIQPINNNIDEIKKKLKKGRPIILYAGVNDYESGLVPYTDETKEFHSPIVRSSEEGLAILEKLAVKNDWNLIYKPHPIIEKRDKLDKVYSDSIIIAQNIDINDVIDLADVVVTILSQVSYIALLRDTAVLMLGYTQLREKKICYEAFRKSDIEKNLLEALRLGYTDFQRKNFEKHIAQMLKYNLFDDLQNKAYAYGQSVGQAVSYIENCDNTEKLYIEKKA